MVGSSSRLQEEIAAARASGYTLDNDRFLSALLAPRPARGALAVLSAFVATVAAVPVVASEPAVGEIRLQWWRDALTATPSETATGYPLADFLRQEIVERWLPKAEILSIIDAFADQLYPGSLATPGAVDTFIDATHGAAFRLAARILGTNEDAASATLLHAAGQSYGRVQLLRSLPALLGTGRNPFGDAAAADWAVILAPLLADARKWLFEARRYAPTVPATILPALLPLALVEPYLAALEDLGADILSKQATISPLTRVWRIFLAKRRRRF